MSAASSAAGRGTLEGIWVKRAHRGVMDPVESADVLAGSGIVGSADQGGRRQVTIIERAVWDDLIRQVGSAVDPSIRRANLLISGLSLRESRGRMLRIGDCRFRVRGETKPCERMEEACPGLQNAMFPDWRGGAFAEVLDNGTLRVGAPVEWVVERRRGPIGALMDEYERAAGDLCRVVEGVSREEFLRVVDTETKDEDCRSLQTIMSHVVGAGYGYADYIREVFSIPSARPPRQVTRGRSMVELELMLAYTAQTLEGRWEMTDEAIQAVSITVRWGPKYDLEQLLEHAIVHILRHRRQIEKFVGMLRGG